MQLKILHREQEMKLALTLVFKDQLFEEINSRMQETINASLKARWNLERQETVLKKLLTDFFAMNFKVLK